MKVKVFTKDFCPYCTNLRKLLKEKDLSFDEVNVTEERELFSKVQKTTGHKTVPMVFVDDKFIGGLDEFTIFLAGSN